MQPTYLPWIGYFDLIDQADVFILDDLAAVQRKSWQTRNLIRARDGRAVWLTVPITAHQDTRLCDVKIAPQPWRRKHRATLEHAYGDAPHWNDLRITVDLIGDPWIHLTMLTEALIRSLAEHLGITTRIVLASRLARLRHGRLERLADMLQSVAATELLDTAGARDVLGVDEIEGIPIRWHQYEHPVYDQGGVSFMSHLSVVDLIAWHGPESLNIIRLGRRAATGGADVTALPDEIIWPAGIPSHLWP